MAPSCPHPSHAPSQAQVLIVPLGCPAGLGTILQPCCHSPRQVELGRQQDLMLFPLVSLSLQDHHPCAELLQPADPR